MVSRLHHVPALLSDTSPGPSSSDDEPVPKRRKQLKSGRDRKGAKAVKGQITWPHEVIYWADGLPATYKDLTMSAFVSSYLILLKHEPFGQVREAWQHISKN